MTLLAEEGRCPTCNHSIDSATDVSGGARPSPGDFTICLYCQDIFRFDERLQMKPLEEADIELLPMDVVSRYQSAITKVMARDCQGQRTE